MEKNINGLIRKKKVKFAQVSCIALKDKKLSLRAKGLYAIIQNYVTLEDFVIYKDYLISISNDGKSSFNRAWDELKENGYLVQYQLKDEAGKIYYEYDLLDEPRVLSKEEAEVYAKKEANRIARNKRKVEQRNKKLKGEDKPQEKGKEPVVEVPLMDETTGGTSTDGSSIDGSSTYINNTDSNNTDFNNTDDDRLKENHQSSSIQTNEFDQEQLFMFLEDFKTLWIDVTKKPMVLGEKEKQGITDLMLKYGSDQVLLALDRIPESNYLQNNLTIHHFIAKFENIANGKYGNREQSTYTPVTQMDNRAADYWDDIEEKERALQDKMLAGEI